MTTFSLEKALKNFEQVTEISTNFLDVDKHIAKSIKTNIKEVYDFIKKEEKIQFQKNSLPQLYVQNLDSEQIWQQIEIQNEKVLPVFIDNICILLVGLDKLLFNNLDKENYNKQNNETSSKNEDSSDDFQYSEKGLNDLVKNIHKTSESDTEETSSDESSNKRKNMENPVDDNFFKLTDMENFLNKEERKLADPDYDNRSDSNESEEQDGIDLFEENFEADIGQDEEAKIARFKDYFVAKDETKRKPKTNKLLEELMTNSEQNSSDQLKSKLELRQERLKTKIDKLEENAVSEKPWQLKGEITGENRPQNSLLEDVVGFDLTSRPAPVITQQASFQLEDIIRQRIKDKVFDSVERKNKPIETPLEYKKKLVLDQEKSKQSLAQIYEKEYFKQQADLDPANVDKEEQEPELHKEVKTLMTNVFSKLDALSNFHFTSKPILPELKIVSHFPAINMEEVAPVAASDSALLAPEEIKSKPKGDIIGKGERTSSHKKGERRKKKLKQKIIYQSKSKKETSRKSL